MTFEAYAQGFGCLPQATPYHEATRVVVPVPLDPGCGEVPGVGLGPLAVLGASRFVETFDADLGFDPLDRGVATLDPPELSYDDPATPLEQIRALAAGILGDGKLPLYIGGERIIALPAARAASERHGDIGVVLVARRPGWLDRDAGRVVTPLTIGRRLSELWPTLVVGPRWWNALEDAALERVPGARMIPAREVLGGIGTERLRAAGLPARAHLSIDVGVLDPSVLPMPGNLEPGGLGWYDLVDLVDAAFESFEVVSCDVSGFAPSFGNAATSLLVAQLVVRCLGRAP
jgi:agmatinase